MILVAQNIAKTYPSPEGDSLKVFENLDFALQPGQRVSLMGPSGSGKTTFMSVLAGLEAPTHGKVFIEKQDFYSLPSSERLRLRSEKVGIIFQQFHLMPFLTALENVSLPLEIRQDKEAQKKALEALDKVGLSRRAKHFPQQMSRGECQRVAIARVIASRPALILADEPTGSLDRKNAESVLSLILDLITEIEGSSLLLVTHDPALALRCEQRYRIESGHLYLEN